MIEAKMAIAKTIEKFPVLLIKRIGLAVRGSLIVVKRKKSSKIMTTSKLDIEESPAHHFGLLI